MARTMSAKFIVVGGGIAGVTCAETVRAALYIIHGIFPFARLSNCTNIYTIHSFTIS